MIQDIFPNTFSNSFGEKTPDKESLCFAFSDGRLLMNTDDDMLSIPLTSQFDADESKFIFLFELSGISCFMLMECKNPPKGYKYEKIQAIRQLSNRDKIFSAATAYHLYNWYRDSRFCGRCGAENDFSHTERAMVCPKCGCINYPRISPAVIAAVTDGDKLLMTKYAGGGYKRYALVAGFTEIGETAEETVRREVMEETGLKVKNIRYYKTQPWGFAGDLLIGYFAELDGSNKIKLDKKELAVAEWMSREDMKIIEDDGISLTREMMCLFKNGGLK